MAEQRPLRVGIIGAGVSGIVTAAHLIEVGVDVTVLERLSKPGGRRPIGPEFPSILASKGEVYPKNSQPDLEQSPPGPCYLGLTNNVSTRLLQTEVSAWPSGTPDFVHHPVIEDYIQNMSRTTGVDAITLYGARVTDQFDGVVASGHHHAPRVPDLLGLKDWRAAWPTRIWHSRSYRKPDEFRGKNILLIGAGTSSTDIERELGPVAGIIYQSSRGGGFDLSAKLLPENGIRVGVIASFDGDVCQHQATHLLDDDPLPGTITLESGQQLCNIHFVVVCTGYHITLPFLSSFHEDNTPVEEASDTILVTDGWRVHNLHKHVFYIPDPTLVFIGLPYHVSTFNLYDFQAVAVAAVFSGRVALPSEEMREEYRNYLQVRGSDKDFHSLGGDEEGYVQPLLDWINKDATAKGFLSIGGHTEGWHVAKAEHIKRITPFFV
ncbi:FAD dependent oxidoreductase [Cenococcum geophilum 1.58]|uniref:FAD dependent oxidoreductase n=1 Tax=Cenococcum geophilum 1.58 TaxID=794803 RepID=A0ACC8EN91_9PEZI|nr:FAD dependent oxidoreductase [Cenococcum geophilum 1.58]